MFLGKRIKELREEKGLLQRQLAAELEIDSPIVITSYSIHYTKLYDFYSFSQKHIDGISDLSKNG